MRLLDRKVSVIAFCAFATAILLVLSQLFYDDINLASWLAISSITGRPAIQIYDGPLGQSVRTFFTQIFALEEPPQVELQALMAECAATSWQRNLYFECQLFTGGLTTFIGSVKVCMHMAIELGANLIIPVTPYRSTEGDLTQWEEKNRKPLGQWFDREFLIERLQKACPEMHVTKLNELQEPIIDVEKHITMNYSQTPLPMGFGPYETTSTPWQAWFKQTVEEEAKDVQGNIVLRAPTPSQFFNVTDPARHSQQAWFELGHLLRSRIRPRKAIDMIRGHLTQKGSTLPYFGVHFRVENDVLEDATWSSPEVQIERILNTVEEARSAYLYGPDVPKMIYLACGDEDQIKAFRARALAKGWITIDKYSVAAEVGSELSNLIKQLDFDHEAMIDMGMLVMSDFFIGLGASAFSFTIAHDRSPTGRYLGSSLDKDVIEHEPLAIPARSHLYQDGGFAYQCCL